MTPTPTVTVRLNQNTYEALEALKGGDGTDSFDTVVRDLLEAGYTGNGLSRERSRRMNNNARTTVERAIQSDDDTGLESVKNVGYMANADGEGGSGN